MLGAAAADPGSGKGQRVYGASGESAAKYARYADGPRELQDITNMATAHCEAEAPGAAMGAAWKGAVGVKDTPSPLGDEGKAGDEESTGLGRTGTEVSTGLGCLRDVSFSEEEEEDLFLRGDFDDFPIGGIGESCIRNTASPGNEDLDEMNDILGHDLEKFENIANSKRSAPPTQEADRWRDEEPAALGQNPPTWRSPSDQGPSLGDAGVGEPPGWHLSSQRDEAPGPPAESAGAAPGAAQRLLAALQLGGEDETGDGQARIVTSDHENDPQDVSEYTLDICDRLALDEMSPQMPRPEYMEAQPELTPHMRAVAVNWLVEVQVKFQLRTETLFLAVSLMDRFLAEKRVRRKDLQLTVVSATFIASKFEEIDPPDVRDFVFITKQACLKQEILAMEVAMLTTLEFCLCRPTGAHFLERYQRAHRCTEAHRHLFQYILELALMDLEMAQYAPSVQAAAALLVSCGLLQGRPVCPPIPERRTEDAERSIRRCAREMCSMLEAAPTSSLQAVRRKFLRPEYSSVAALDF